MANKALFQSARGAKAPAADTFNSAGGVAYTYSSRHALAQYAATGCLNSTFYSTAKEDLDRVIALSAQVETELVAKTAIYARERGFMKDMPAVLCAALSVLDAPMCTRVFNRVIDDGKMLRNFVQIVRSGAVGRKSLGSMPKRLVKGWLDKREDAAIFRASVGNDPSLGDVIKLAHPKPQTKSREALYGYLLGKAHDASLLPDVVKDFEAFKAKTRKEVPDVPFQLLSGLNLGTKEWTAIAKNASWQTTRMNLNTFLRHGVFTDRKVVDLVAARLANKDEVRKARVFPYQLLMAYKAAGADVPARITAALEQAMEHALYNVPAVDGKVIVLPDVSGSMQSPATGYRKGSSSQVRCVDVAALVAAAMLRKNRDCEVIPFEQQVVKVRLNPNDSVITNATRLAAVGGGGTNCSAPLMELNKRRERADLVIYVSDNESWVDSRGRGQSTATMEQWEEFKKRNPRAKLVCIDIQPNKSTQAPDRDDILNVGGFSDAVFDVIAAFSNSGNDSAHWLRMIESIKL
ncbi:MAG: TROVE domain-containing protein [Polyangiaceae bacterium]|nr:TROVE domain-containing protein [Polyangiaceae bacterium]